MKNRFSKILIPLLMLLFLVTCKEYTFENPVDTNNEIIAPSELTVIFSADTMAVLKWNYEGVSPQNFLAEVSKNDTLWIELGRVTDADSIIVNYNFLTGTNYYFRVGAYHDENISKYISSMVFIEPIEAPTNLSVNVTSDTTVSISWQDNSEFESGFIIEISEDGQNYSSVISVQENVSNCTITYHFLPGIRYSFRIKAKTSVNYSEYSEITTGLLIPAKPSLYLPGDGSTDQELNLLLKWYKNKDQVKYELQVSSDSLFSSIIVQERELTDSVYLVSALDYFETYYWRVRASNEFWVSEWSESFYFQTDQKQLDTPALKSPLNNSANQEIEVELRWHQSVNAEYYNIQIAEDELFESIVKEVNNHQDTTLVIDELKYQSRYYWRVQSQNSKGISVWSNIWSFSTKGIVPNSPELVFPEDGAILHRTTVLFEWTKPEYASYYNLQVSTSSSFDSYFTNESNILNNSKEISGFRPDIDYYWRVRANNTYGYSDWSSPIQSFRIESVYTSCPNVQTVEYGGKIYHTVLIGDQCWLKENLDVGIMISGSENSSDNNIIEKFCYDNNPANCNTYGGLYQWEEALQYNIINSKQGICPDGWHIPYRSEFEVLIDFVNEDGNALKELGQGSGEGAGTNSSGFSGLLAGSRFEDGTFGLINGFAIFWSSLEETLGVNEKNGFRLTWQDNDLSTRIWNPQNNGLSIRCIQGENTIPMKPILISPENYATDQSASPIMQFQESDMATSYTLQISEYEDFHDCIINTNTIPGSGGQIESLSYSVTYYWRVSAENEFGTSGWSEVWSFTTTNSNSIE